MEQALDTLVTKEYLTAELDRRFGTKDKWTDDMDKQCTRLESKMDEGFASLHECIRTGEKILISVMMASTLVIIAMQIATILVILD